MSTFGTKKVSTINNCKMTPSQAFGYIAMDMGAGKDDVENYRGLIFSAINSLYRHRVFIYERLDTILTNEMGITIKFTRKNDQVMEICYNIYGKEFSTEWEVWQMEEFESRY